MKYLFDTDTIIYWLKGDQNSIALVNKLILVTTNTNHFKRIPGLKIENWVT